MQLVKQKAELWEQGYTVDEIWEHIARCARVCYQSEAKEGESGFDFCHRVLIPRRHYSVLEHGTVYMELPFLLSRKYETNPYSRVVGIYVTTNMRVIFENGWQRDLDFVCNPTDHHVLRHTISYITGIDISREYNRHRCHSISEESTRYVNYGKKGGVKFIIPEWCKAPEGTYDIGDFGELYVNGDLNNIYKPDDEAETMFIYALCADEQNYLHLLNFGWKPQQARKVLPLDTKTQCVHTAFRDDWFTFLNLRDSPAAHPDARKLAKMTEELIA